VDVEDDSYTPQSHITDFVTVSPTVVTYLRKLELLVPSYDCATDIWDVIADCHLPALRTIIISSVPEESPALRTIIISTVLSLRLKEFWKRHPRIERVECSEAFSGFEQGMLPNLRFLAVR
jgi:hypothetical protein